MKVEFVVPRYGSDVIGGAELAARQLAEHLAARPGFSVGVLTTCALDARSWADALAPGVTEERGVRVHRFRAVGRSPDFDRLAAPMLAAPERMRRADADRFVALQGPVSEELVGAVRASDADLVVFSPYLFHPTVWGVAAATGRAVLHAAAHDEAVLRIPRYQEVFAAASAHVYYTHAEQRLVQSRFPVAAAPQIVLGLGADEPPPPAEVDDPVGIGADPYLLCLGRVEGAKGTDDLARLFAVYKQRHPGPLRLVFAGPVAGRPPAHPDVVVAGEVDEAVKWALLRGARALVSPSRNESFGIVLFEAWSAGTPVLVNGACAATREHCERSGGGLWFVDGPGFEVAVARLAADPSLGARLAASGAAYTRRSFAWPVVVERYATFLRSVAARRPGSAESSGSSGSLPVG